MSGWKMHVLFGTLITVLFYVVVLHYNAFGIGDLRFFLYLPLIFYYSQLPDVDSETSIVRRITMGVLLIMMIILGIMILLYREWTYMLYLIGAGAILLLILGTKHRGRMHTILAGVLLSLPIMFIGGYLLATLCFLAYLSHLFLDNKLKLY